MTETHRMRPRFPGGRSGGLGDRQARPRRSPASWGINGRRWGNWVNAVIRGVRAVMAVALGLNEDQRAEPTLRAWSWP
jgi:hypothetical protein